MKHEYSQWLTNEDIENTSKAYIVQDEKSKSLTLVETTDYRSTTPTYGIVCPVCNTHGQIWPRQVKKSNSRKLEDALDSGGDSLSIGIECEECNTFFDLVVEKRNCFQLRLKQTGYRTYD